MSRALYEAQATFEESSDFIDAADAMRQMASDYQFACNAALEPLQQTLGYRQASDRMNQLDQKFSWGHFDDHLSDD